MVGVLLLALIGLLWFYPQGKFERVLLPPPGSGMGQPILDLVGPAVDRQGDEVTAAYFEAVQAGIEATDNRWIVLSGPDEPLRLAAAFERLGGDLEVELGVRQGGLAIAAVRAPVESAPLPREAAAYTAWIRRYASSPLRREALVPVDFGPDDALPVAQLPMRNDPDAPRASPRVILVVDFLAPDAALDFIDVRRPPRFTAQYASPLYTAPDLSGPPQLGRVAVAGDQRTAVTLPLGTSHDLVASSDPTGLAERTHLRFAFAGLQPGAPAELVPLELTVEIRWERSGEGLGDGVRRSYVLDPLEHVLARHWVPAELELPELPTDEVHGVRVRLSARLAPDGSDVSSKANGEASRAPIGNGEASRAPVGNGAPSRAIAVSGLELVGHPAAKAYPNVFLVSLDTLRRDRVGKDGQRGSLTPRLDAFEKQALVFEGATAPAPFTLPTHGTVFTGLLPTEHGGTDFKTPLASRPERLAETFSRSGWSTAAFTGGGFLAPEFGFDRGFDRYTIHDPWITAETLPALSQPTKQELLAMTEEEWADQVRLEAAYGLKARGVRDHILARRDGPQFVFLHTYAAHQYQPPKRIYLEELGDSPSQLTMRPMIGALDDARFKREPPSDVDIEHMRGLYDACARHADEEFGKFLDFLDAEGFAENSYVVVFSDHGEQLFEHGQFGHSNNVWETLLGVPLMIRGPSVTPERIPEPVSLLDLGPTVAALAGFGAWPRPVDDVPPSLGQALVDVVGRDLGEREVTVAARVAHTEAGVFSELSRGEARFDSLILETHKLIRRYGAEGQHLDRLFDLAADPGEQHDLASAEPELRARLAERLEAWRALVDARAAGETGSAELNAALQQQLEDLGYL